MIERTTRDATAVTMPNNAGKGKILATSVAVGGQAVLRGVSRELVERGLEKTVGVAVARNVVRGGSRVAARVAPVLAVAEFAMDQQQTSRAYREGLITRAQYRAETGGNAGNAAGGLAGAAAGAWVGTAFCPGIGTLVGAILGGLWGGVAGRDVGTGIGRGCG